MKQQNRNLTAQVAIFCSRVNVYSADKKQETAFNRLIHEKSPYLLQHSGNPVDWYPWGEEAFQTAKKEGKPIFLSIGYSTCHWCHVMAHESFGNKEIARLLNKSFISIKVDREERPDIDKIYMAMCQAMTGSGGWPLSIFITAEGKPFFAGTYFPRYTRMGIPGLIDILKKITELWEKDRDQLLDFSEKITKHLQYKDSDGLIYTFGPETLKKGYSQLEGLYDPEWGGFGNAPKFPMPHQLTFLLRWHKRNESSKALMMVEKTLDAMRGGGIFDQIGLGFHRYSVDEKWLAPHFEKMLYDQALLAISYIEAYQMTGKDKFARVAHEIFTYVQRDMTSPEGGFYSAEDADSEGEEGLFYLWTPGEVKQHLGEKLGDLFCRFYDITEKGNFEEGMSIPNIPLPIKTFVEKEGLDLKETEKALRDAGQILFNVREKRTRPLKDDKILTSWNGLMLAAFAKGYQAFGIKDYARTAKRAADFMLNNLKSDNGKLLRRYRQGDVSYSAYLDDYAFFITGLIDLYEAIFEVSYLEEAISLNRIMMDIFWDKEDGGLYFTGKGNEKLITKTKEAYDGAIPSGNSVAALNIMRLARITGDADLEKRAEELLRAFSGHISNYPAGYTQLLSALDFMVGPSQEIAIAGDIFLEGTQDMINAVHRAFLPNKVFIFRPQGRENKRLSSISPFTNAMDPVDNRPTAYICENFACKRPITDIETLKATFVK